MLTQHLTDQFLRAALGHVTREYPTKLDHVLTGPADLVSQRELHPIFFGSYDWHSCVHAHWLLARLLRRDPADADRVRQHFNTTITPENVATEVAYLARPNTGTFERPYGWAWLLMLCAELHLNHAAEIWTRALQPLADAFAQRFLDFLPKFTWPVRSGGHANTAFALALTMDYARARRDEALKHALTGAARRYYLNDADCQAWEPGGEDFLSPCLIEAECMRRILPAEEFTDWFDKFLPHLAQREPSTLFQPVAVSDRTDGRIAHLDGLNFSRAWCWSNLAASLPASDPRAKLMRHAAVQHMKASIDHIAEHYMGEHWLATFALLALEAAEDG